MCLNQSLCLQGLFLIPELQDYSGFYLLQHQASAEVELLVEEATSRNRSRKMVAIFDELSDCLCRVADMVRFVFVHACMCVCMRMCVC